MVSWILIAVALVLLIIIGIKLKEVGAKTKLTLLVVILIVLAGTVGYVYLVTKPDITSYGGFISLGKSYFAWVASLFGNMGGITGYAVQQDWGLNSTGLG